MRRGVENSDFLYLYLAAATMKKPKGSGLGRLYRVAKTTLGLYCSTALIHLAP